MLPLVPALPLLGAVVNGLLRSRVSRNVTGAIASAAVAGSALISFATLFSLLGHHGEGHGLHHTLYTWIGVGNFQADIGFLADPLAATMMCVVTGVGFLIHVYSIGYMDDDSDKDSVWRFFCYLNLFVFSMLLLIMGDNFLLMFVGWEGVGACSYLLIGFWFSDTANAVAGKKAFVTNRVGDFCFVLGLFWLFWSLGDHATINFTELGQVLHDHPGLLGGVGGLAATGIALLFFGGATGKSAQIPLYVWLPDAMAGPTPVSALIHAATMVTAGVYMLCRLNFLYILAPVAMGVVALVGALTALVAATIALSQFDIKKVLAYSTVSQLGYMVMAAGMGAYTAAFFHVMTHAFFKALLFLGAGSIIHALHHEQDMRNMGGLRKFMPVTFWTFTAAYLAIIGVPGFSGFFSKDEILWLTFSTPASQVPLFGESFPLPTVLWAIGFVTAVMTAFYMSRLYFMTFFGEYRGGGHADHGDDHHGDDHHGDDHHGDPHESPAVITIPLVVLAVLSVFGGLLNLPHWLPGYGKLHHFLEPSLEAAQQALAPPAHGGMEFPLMGITLLAIAISVGIAWKIYGAGGKALPIPEKLVKGSQNLWYVDEIYAAILLSPIYRVSRKVLWAIVDVRIIDGLVNGVASGARWLGNLYSRTFHVGQTQGYALSLAIGSALLILFFAIG
ncbi:MAG: NADH-quinone oxidoreductase subunit L [Myxococcota bacterium]|nr:NADH-quinone oxidoreductase subunit L [Myxococcota bacterium]